MAQDLGKCSTNLDPKVAALLSYVLTFVTGIIFYLIEKDNKFVRFHALQSILTFGALAIFQFLAGLLLFFMPLAIPFVTGMVALAALALWIVLMIKAYQGELFKLPVVGDIAEQKTQK